MSQKTVRLVAIVAVFALFGLVVAVAASAAPTTGTWTRITTPSSNVIYKYNFGGTNSLAISGQASPDVTNVDIDCLVRGQTGAIYSAAFATNVPVSTGAFSVTATVPAYASNCRLRAVPTGVDPTSSGEYLGSYAGPIFYSNTFVVLKADGVNPMGYTATDGQGTGSLTDTNADQCGATGLSTITTPAMETLGPLRSGGLCLLFLPSTNMAGTASAIVVDGHNGFLPLGVWNLKNQSIPITQTQLSTSFTRRANGDITFTESGPLVRCSHDDTFPPTTTSCPSAVSTGVTFTRTADLFRGAHQIRFRDSFRSVDAKQHSVHAQYEAIMSPAATGTQGFRFPGHGSAFSAGALDKVVTGLGTRAATLMVRSDIHSFEGDPQAETIGLTWSRAPSRVQFSHVDTNTFVMPYALTVPAGSKAYLGFAASQANTTTTVAGLAGLAAREMAVPPTIRTPKPGAVIHGHATTVKGRVFLGANGMPTSVNVNGHRAALTRVSATIEAYAVTFSETYARHKLTVVARDVAGNTSSRSVRVTNKP